MYGAVAERLTRSTPADWWHSISEWKKLACPFLARRCDEIALRTMVDAMPDLVEMVFDVGYQVTAFFNERHLAATLLRLELATADDRRRLVETLNESAADGLDGAFLANDDWMIFFRPYDLSILDQRRLVEIVVLVDVNVDQC